MHRTSNKNLTPWWKFVMALVNAYTTVSSLEPVNKSRSSQYDCSSRYAEKHK